MIKLPVAAFQQMRRAAQGPAWRWQTVQAALSADQPSLRQLDAISKETLRYLRSLPVKREKPAGHVHHDIAYAIHLSQKPHAWRLFRLAVLGGCSPSDVAECTSYSLSVAEIAEQLFFDVRPMIRMSAWIDLHIIQPEIKRQDFEFATQLKASLLGGPLAAKCMASMGGLFSSAGADVLFHRDILLHSKFLTCMTAPMGTEEQRSRLMQIYLAYREKRERLELDKDRFRAKCEKAIRAHELALLKESNKAKQSTGAESEPGESS